MTDFSFLFDIRTFTVTLKKHTIYYIGIYPYKILWYGINHKKVSVRGEVGCQIMWIF